MWSSSSPHSCHFGNGDTQTCCLVLWHWELWVFLSGGKVGPEVGGRMLGSTLATRRCEVVCCHGGETPSQQRHLPSELLAHDGAKGGRFIFPPGSYSLVFSLRLFVYVYVHIAYVQRPAWCTRGPQGSLRPLVYPWLHQHAGHR